MKLKSLAALLIAAAFLFAVGCKEKANEAAAAKPEVKAKAADTEKKEAVEKEAKEEGGEKEEVGEKAEAKPAALDLKVLPEAVLAAFKAAYPAAEIKGASKEVENGVTQFEVESVDGKLNRDLIYSVDGKVIELEETTAPENLPEAVQKTLAKDYPGAKVLKAEILTKDGAKSFELSLQVKDKKMGVTIDPTGKIVEKAPAEKTPAPPVKK
jgi:Putative beta-lactamase-inhibitor-like, PepSY-like